MNDNIVKAIEFASFAHKDQTRKGTQIPYVAHIFEVALTLAQNNASTDAIIAGILHDTVEDTPTTIEEIKQHFGQNIANIVSYVTENKALSWEERKQHTLDIMKTAPLDAQLVTCADKLSNIRTLNKQIKDIGEDVWQLFKRGYDKQKWYFTGLVESLSDLQDYSMYKEFKQLVNNTFNLTKNKQQ